MCHKTKLKPLPFFNKNGFGIKKPMKVNMLLNKRNQTRPNQTKDFLRLGSKFHPFKTKFNEI